MSINKLEVFASDADAQKSIIGLELERGFPKSVKPARQWFNYLFNGITSKINELAEAVDILNAEEAYKVGDLYITTTPSTAQSVAQRHGYGTWQRFGQGKALIGVSETASDPDWTKQVGNVFGDYTHQLTIDEMPSHTHDVAQIRSNIDLDNGGRDSGTQNGLGASVPAGGDQPHNNVQPSIVIEVWRRVA